MPKQDRHLEIWLALLAILLVSLVYLFAFARLGSIPAARNLFGHSIGIIGFLMMLMTEGLYSLRKRSRLARWGRMSSWLRFHIFTGLVGPFMVLLHTSWKFHGLAGFVTWMTVVVVASGFIGRYIYTAIPRTADGMEIETAELERLIAALEADLRGDSQEQSRQRERFVRRQQALRRQVDSLAASRRLLSVWHSIHIPIGMLLFALAFVHIVGAIYYATLLR